MKKIFKLADPENIVVFGRTATVAEGTVLFWTGSAVEFNIKASELYINIECGYDERELMLDIMLDGERSQKLTLENGIRKYTIFKGMDPEIPSMSELSEIRNVCRMTNKAIYC